MGNWYQNAQGGGDNRAIMFGRHEIMEHVVPDLSGNGDPTEGTFDREGQPKGEFLFGVNPDLMVAMDQKSKIYGTGTINCVTCRHFVANDVCPKLASWGKVVVLNQQNVRQFDIGGCAAQELVKGLDNGRNDVNEVYDKISATVHGAENEKTRNSVVVYRNGQIIGQPLTHYDLKIHDPNARSREFEEFAKPVPEEEHEQDW
jgi:hypothetical protein